MHVVAVVVAWLCIDCYLASSQMFDNLSPNVKIQGNNDQKLLFDNNNSTTTVRGAGPGDPEPDQCSQPGVQVPQKVSFHVQPRGLEL